MLKSITYPCLGVRHRALALSPRMMLCENRLRAIPRTRELPRGEHDNGVFSLM
jgi:hypothetical protein